MAKVTPLFPEIPLFSSHPVALIFLLPDFAGAYRYPGRLPGLGGTPSPRPPAPDASPPHTPAPEASPASPASRAPRSLAASSEAARALFELRPYVEHVLRRCRVPEKDLADTTQDVFIQTLPWWSRRPLEEIRSQPGRGRSYVCTVAVNTASHRLRRSALRLEVLGWAGDEPEHAPGDIAAPLPSFSPSAEDLWLEHEEVAERAAAVDLDRLSRLTHPAFWRTFYAHVVMGLPIPRIAEAEETSPGTVYQRLRLACRDLRAALRRFHAVRRAR